MSNPRVIRPHTAVESPLIIVSKSALALLLLSASGLADLSIDKVKVDGAPQVHVENLDKPEALPNVIEISSKNEIQFEFSEKQPPGQSTARLRYKLEGIDEKWRDLRPRTPMRLILQFSGSDRRGIGITPFEIEGETAGWRGKIEWSDFQDFREQTFVPEAAAYLRFQVTSAGSDAGIGVIGIDALHLQVESPSGDSSRDYDFAVRESPSVASDPAQADPAKSGAANPATIPAGPLNWRREGSWLPMALLGVRPDPTPHKVLVLDDNRSTHNAAWGLELAEQIPVLPGERLTITWQSAHSIGSSGLGQAKYTGLPAGHYRFWVATAKSNGDLLNETISVPVTVVAPLYTRWQFWLPLVALGVGGAFWGGSFWNRHLLKKRFAQIEREHALERERTRISRDLHDDVGAGLTEIAMQSNWVLRDIEATAGPDTRRRIERVCQSAVELTRSVDEIVWAVNPANDTLDRFVNYLKQASKLFLDSANLRVRFDIPLSLPPMELAGRLRHCLFLAVREALNNVAKHANANLVRIELRLEGTKLHLIVEDDGQGFDLSQQNADGIHEGLDGMRRRMEEIGGSCQISSAPGDSARVEFILPLAIVPGAAHNPAPLESA